MPMSPPLLLVLLLIYFLLLLCNCDAHPARLAITRCPPHVLQSMQTVSNNPDNEVNLVETSFIFNATELNCTAFNDFLYIRLCKRFDTDENISDDNCTLPAVMTTAKRPAIPFILNLKKNLSGQFSFQYHATDAEISIIQNSKTVHISISCSPEDPQRMEISYDAIVPTTQLTCGKLNVSVNLLESGYPVTAATLATRYLVVVDAFAGANQVSTEVMFLQTNERDEHGAPKPRTALFSVIDFKGFDVSYICDTYLGRTVSALFKVSAALYNYSLRQLSPPIAKKKTTIPDDDAANYANSQMNARGAGRISSPNVMSDETAAAAAAAAAATSQAESRNNVTSAVNDVRVYNDDEHDAEDDDDDNDDDDNINISFWSPRS